MRSVVNNNVPEIIRGQSIFFVKSLEHSEQLIRRSTFNRVSGANSRVNTSNNYKVFCAEQEITSLRLKTSKHTTTNTTAPNLYDNSVDSSEKIEIIFYNKRRHLARFSNSFCRDRLSAPPSIPVPVFFKPSLLPAIFLSRSFICRMFVSVSTLFVNVPRSSLPVIITPVPP